MRLKPLVLIMGLLPVAVIPTTTAVFASDLSLYKGNSAGKTSILLMLDTSGSMGISSLVLPKNNVYGSPGDVDTSLCDRVKVSEHYSDRRYTTDLWQWTYNLKDATTNRTATKKTVTIGNTPIDYYVRGCRKNGITQYDRLSRLKDAIIPLLASSDLSDDVVMGLGRFSSKTEITIGTASNRLTDGHSGSILVPNAKLTAEQRVKIALQIAAIKSLDTTTNEDGTSNSNLKLSSNNYPNVTKAASGTPTVQAYAEAAAYMMGTTTGTGGTNSGNVDTIYDGYMVKQQNNNDGQVYFICTELGTGTTSALGAIVRQCPSDWPDYDNGTASSTTIRKPNGSGGWTVVSFADYKTYVAAHPALGGTGGVMSSLWDVYKNLPIGWRFDGWMRVDNEPMDIEPIVGTVWGYGDGITGLVSYRTSPFSIKSESTLNAAATCTQNQQALVRPFDTKRNGDWKSWKSCQTGYSPIGNWESLCVKSGTWTRNATQAEINDSACKTPADGSTNPIPGARNPNGSVNNNERYNMTNTYYTAATYTVTPIEMSGGFAYSAADTKDGSVYKTGGSTSSCDGNGIYFLTDGAPNSTKDTIAQSIMNTTLNNNNSYKFNAKPSGTGVLLSPRLQSGLFAGETGGWEFIGEYAKKLRNRTDASNTQKNPKDMNIKTAVVGFGSSFVGIPKNADGTYACNSAPNEDAKNACLWGSKAYGDGGFYYAENSEDIKNSIIKFVSDVTVGFTPSSLGSISVPRDPLDQTKYMTQGFFPMVMPMEDTTLRTWAGNLKKYNIVGGTLKDSSGNAIYKLENNQQVINSSAKDLWSNAAIGADHSLINSGGAWNKIPVPSTATEALDAISNLNSVRKVYVLDGSSLKQITTQNLATNYTGTGQLTGTYTVNQRLALLNYLGYKTTFPAAATQTTLTNSEIAPLAVNPASPYRFLGGVVHSTPLMVTKESTVSSNNAVGSREEYTVYGSMEGGLHIVNSATGKEQSVFVPQEILSNQYDTLANGNSKGVDTLTGVAYGVDAPWVADNTFKVQTTTSNGTATTKYIANKMNIYGGLRMGGKALYGLNIIDPTRPALLFQIKPSTTGFSRMAQIWSKPTVAEIRVKGERKKVLIFGGGYDADVYEKPAATFIEPSSSTYGNALYVVDATTGALIWMSSSDTSGITYSYKKTTQADLKYSVVGQPVVRDYDADGLADMIYFADLGGQIFRVDLNNNNQMSKTTDNNIAVRVQTLAKLRTTDTTPFVPRFYDRLSTAVFDDGQDRFVLVTAGSGNRSFPLEEERGGKNKIYGLIDRDAAANDLEKSTFTPATVITPTLLSSDGILGKTVTKQISNTNIAKMKLTTGSDMLRGWSFELRSVDSGNYARAFEESQLITGDLYVSLYDPKATLTGTVNTCGGGVTGISTTHRICMPYGDCAAYVKTSYQGINGPAFGVVSSSDPRTTSLVAPIAETREACVGNCPTANTSLTDKNLPTYSQVRKIKPVRWFEW